jgi:flagellar hook-length control protein FliK
VASSTIFPFPATRGVSTPPRPPAPVAARRDDFAGAMDNALDVRAPRRADAGSRPAARRPDAPRPREAADKGAVAPARNPNTAKQAARPGRLEAPADEAPVERKADASPNDTAVVAASQPETAPEPKTEGAALAQAGDQAAEDTAGDAVANAAVICAPASLPGDGEADGEADADGVEGTDPLARGRRWTPPGDEANAPGEASPNSAALRGKGAHGLGLKLGHAIQQAREDASATPGEALAQVAKNIVAAAHAEAGSTEATGEPVTQAVETAIANAQTAAAASAETAIETAASLVDAVAAAEGSADTTPGDAQAQEHAQAKPQAPNGQAGNGPAVAVGGVESGMKFTVNSAAGTAAYTSAAPRAEETVLPQIVQSIRLQAVQGVSEARVQLKPEHLGNLNITLKVEHNQVTATIQADVAAVRQWIESHEASLRQSLSEQGLELARLEVHPDGQQASRDEQGGDQPRRQPRRRAWHDEATFEVLV